MNRFKLIIITAIFTATIATIAYSDLLINFGIDFIGLSWFSSYLLPRILIIIFSLLLVIIFWFYIEYGKKIKLFLSVFTPIIILVSYLVIYPPYLEDYSKRGINIEAKHYKNNTVIAYLNKTYPHFNGLICIATPECPYCKIAVSKLSRVLKRHPEKNIIVFLFTNDINQIEDYRQTTKAYNIDFQLAPDEQGIIELCEGRFPTFLYFRNNDIIHKWYNEQFGYPAFTWIENDLN